MNKKLMTAGILGVFVGVVAAAQRAAPQGQAPGTDSTRTIQAQFGASTGLAAVLTRSCGDCHSRTMKSGWYTRVPPFSTMMGRAAKEGRKAVDFAEWSSYSPEQRHAFLLASCAAAKSGRMPMGSYLRFRGDARLSTQDVEIICSATEQPRRGP